MAQAPVFYTRQHGWDTTSTDYHVHVSTMERMPSILPDVPRYPNVHRAFNNKTIHEDEFEVTHQESMQKQRQPPTTHGKKRTLIRKQMDFSSESTRHLSYANGKPSSCYN
ncbi:conserved hypothetical protein [Ricinus communis]|uniref:Uncharacterized protein n=1 Tax=Ricinus communis TaxID=3988 RepID=B9RAU2_RICCO|nr:conserved hypothetical protein [Ricinus communis]